MCSVVACASQEKKEAPIVKDLKLTGNHQISSRQIEKKILTSDTGWWPFATKHRFDPFAWQADLKRIERLYESRGFYQAEVVRDQVKPLPKNQVALEVMISEGQPTHISAIEIKGLDSLPVEDRQAALDDLPLAGGAPFTESSWAAAKQQLLARLRDRGYARAEVEGLATIDVGTHRAALTITARTGLRYVFGDIHVKTGRGARISPVWIWEQARLAIPEGQRTSEQALDEAQRRVFGMGVFATVKVTAEEPDDASGRMAVLVETREAPFRTLRLGGGVRADEIRNEARLIAEWINRDFLGGMRKLTLHGEAGWAFIPNTYAVLSNQVDSGPRNGPIARLRAELEQPRLAGRPSLRARGTLEAERTLEQAYDALASRLMAGVIWQVRSRLSVFPSYHLEADYLNGPPIASAASSPLTLGCDTSSDHCFVWLSYLDETLTWDRRDHPLEPRNGAYASLSLQEGGGPLGGRFTYLRVLPEARGYLSFGEDDELTLSARLRAGDLWTRSGDPGDSAVVTRFYGGGGVSMRGFNDRRLSPLLEAPAPGANPGVTLTLPIGGNGIIDGSFEARYSLTSSLRVAAFVDFGQVTRGPLGPDDVAQVLWAVGVGVRYLTAIGPIRLDIARRLPFGRLPTLYKLNPLTGMIEVQPYDPDNGCFGIGGSQQTTRVSDGLCVLHISIGEAF
ncbi:MAG TPA: BamA/TamA family outer membrane protein [Polyangia bacterium]|nr:BamA/TamA family outer membrane protein [Polyangia bacterium]